MFTVDKPSVVAYKVEPTEQDGKISLATSESDIDISALLAWNR